MFDFHLRLDDKCWDSLVIPNDFKYTKEEIKEAFYNFGDTDVGFKGVSDWMYWEETLKCPIKLSKFDKVCQDKFDCFISSNLVLVTPEGCGTNEATLVYEYTPIINKRLEFNLKLYWTKNA